MSGGAQRLYACPVMYADLEACGSGLTPCLDRCSRPACATSPEALPTARSQTCTPSIEAASLRRSLHRHDAAQACAWLLMQGRPLVAGVALGEGWHYRLQPNPSNGCLQ